MLQELVWNVDFLRGIILLALGIVAAILLIPRILKRLQVERDKQLAKALFKAWGNDCILALWRLKPLTSQTIHIQGYDDGNTEESKRRDAELNRMKQFWIDMRDGKKEPVNSALLLHAALHEVLFSKREGEKENKKPPPKKTYPLGDGDLEISRALIKGILNSLYAKLEIFDMELLPISELEIAMSYIEHFSQLGRGERKKFGTYAFHLALSMEKFATYLWKLENRPIKSESTLLTLR
jgi:hypothetical protein